MKHLDPSGDPIIPAHWTPQQAVAVFEILDELRDRVWSIYGPQIQQCLKKDRASAPRHDLKSKASPPF